MNGKRGERKVNVLVDEEVKIGQKEKEGKLTRDKKQGREKDRKKEESASRFL